MLPAAPHHSYIRADLSLKNRLLSINWSYFLLVAIIASIGFLVLYSAGLGNPHTWMYRQMFRFAVGLAAMLAVALTDIRIFARYAYWIYFICLLLLLLVEVLGVVGMGAQRWLSLGAFNLQPSELMKVALILALAKYFNGTSLDEIRTIRYLLPPALMVLLPTLLVLRQPDLGTAMLLCLSATIIFFLVGVQWWKFGLVALAGVISIPIAWNFLHDYQKQRVLTFLDPERDKLGAGYHIIQSKITLGSGGVFGKGFMEGTQSKLNFLPEKHTDFIFTVLAEDFGLFGCIALLVLYLILIVYGMSVALKSSSFFGRLMTMGITMHLAIYIFFNIAMVMGMVPVTGVPLPLISYGGTSMVVILASCGLIECANINRDVQISKSS
jgi:rod shape determining protein RodA